MSDELKDQRIPIMMTASEVKAIDDWMFENRTKSRAEAIRTLVRNGLRFQHEDELSTAFIPVLSALRGKGDVASAIQEFMNKYKSYEQRERKFSDRLQDVKDYYDQIQKNMNLLKDDK